MAADVDEDIADTLDEAVIGALIRTFFAAFVSGDDAPARLDALPGLFLPEAVIVRTGPDLAVYGVESFIAPRRDLLTSGRLTDFTEHELAGHTAVAGDVAQHLCTYTKSGLLDGRPFTGRGVKTFQLVRTTSGWRLSAVAWSDE
ncbi:MULTISPECIES: nuclear transport factor 2 family protein [Actinoplanes]|uniref:nuclear transport factor 2 family protein n=1 Tax=Actinoplanes TaxID=1865 RepID=UPI0005F2F4F2|nr:MULTISPECIES: nuclear transport factor 2 family protein [Actinoplanes]GLY02696.1 hypothetical protein Acsp01_30750 [Actinoplanes sp. NBRC 101535]